MVAMQSVAGRKVVTFQVLLKPDDDAGPALYLGADPELAAVPVERAVTITACLSTTTPERVVAKERMAALAAGPGVSLAQATRRWMELKAAAESMRAVLLTEARTAHAVAEEAAAATTGRPASGELVMPRQPSPEEMEAIFAAHLARRPDDALSEAWQQATATIEEIEAVGTLSVVILSPDPYNRLHEIPVPPQRLGAIWGAYEKARQDYVLGKEQPSGS